MTVKNNAQEDASKKSNFCTQSLSIFYFTLLLFFLRKQQKEKETLHTKFAIFNSIAQAILVDIIMP